MKFAKIVVKYDYEEKGDLVFRPLKRAYEKMQFSPLIENNNAILLGIVRDNNFYELFTWKEIPFSKYQEIELEEFYNIIDNFSMDKVSLLKKTINALIFNKNKEIDNSVYAIEELAKDRAIEFDAYDNDLTSINPYNEPLNGYNDFSYKCKILEKK